MKRLFPLMLLPLFVAACGQPAAPKAQASSLLTAGQATPLQFDLEVQGDLARLGLGGPLTAQAVAPKSYLNVLKLGAASARAYFKTSYPAGTACTLDWGDGTAANDVTTPTPAGMSVQTADHAYTSSGTYAIKLTCGTDVKTMSFKADVPLNTVTVDFEEFKPAQYMVLSAPLPTKGLKFSFNTYDNYIFAAGYPYGPVGHSYLTINGTEGGAALAADNGLPFELVNVNASNYSGNGITLTAYDSNNQLLYTAQVNNRYPGGMQSQYLDWKNVQYVRVTGDDYIFIDDLTVRLQSP